MTDHIGDVVLNHVGELCLVLDVADPAWQLRMPDECVASHDLIVLSCVVGKVIGASVGEFALRGLRGVPFLGHCQYSLV